MSNLLHGKLGGLLKTIPYGAAAAGGPPSSGLIARYRADTGVTGTTDVSAWTDMTGNGYDLAQATGGNQPELVTGVLNSQPVIRFTKANVDHLERITTPALNQPYTWVGVVRPDASSGSQWIISGGDFRGFLIGLLEVRSFSGNTFSSGIDLSTSVFKTVISGHNGTSSEIYVDNVGAAGNPGNAHTSSMAGVRIGNGDASGNTEPFGGDVAEVMLYDHMLDAGERTTLASYITSQYGI